MLACNIIFTFQTDSIYLYSSLVNRFLFLFCRVFFIDISWQWILVFWQRWCKRIGFLSVYFIINQINNRQNGIKWLVGYNWGFKGLEAVRWDSYSVVNRKTQRKENASADSVENENERKQVDWLEKRIVQCTAKSVERTALVSRSTSYMALSSLWMNWLQPMATTWLIFGFMVQENRLTARPGKFCYWLTVT